MKSKWKNLALSSQGLACPSHFGSALSGARSAIEHLGYVQIDTLAVVERAHHHTLWSRVPDYDPLHLNQLIHERHIFEYWFHAASYLPMRDYRFALPRMASIRNGENRYFTQSDEHLMGEIIARVRGEGALRLRDIDVERKEKGSWWSWGPGRRALDTLFMQGDLMVCERNGMEKIYDLTERCLPDGMNLREPSVTEYVNYLLDTTLRAHGITTLKQLLHLKTGKLLRDAMRNVLNQRIDEGSVSVFTSDDSPTFYADSRALEKAPTVAAGVLKILSPFDNAVIHRDRLSTLFGFDYRLECYVPKTKRVFGYFCLPVLLGNEFVGRIDCKAHRAEQRFEVLSLHLENRAVDWAQFFPRLMNEVQQFADFNRCPRVCWGANTLPLSLRHVASNFANEDFS